MAKPTVRATKFRTVPRLYANSLGLTEAAARALATLEGTDFGLAAVAWYHEAFANWAVVQPTSAAAAPDRIYEFYIALLESIPIIEE